MYYCLTFRINSPLLLSPPLPTTSTSDSGSWLLRTPDVALPILFSACQHLGAPYVLPSIK